MTPPMIADLKAALAPMRADSTPPVRAPAAIAFQWSSLCLIYISVQSKDANNPPHTAKLPPIRGDSFLMACMRPSDLE